MDNPETQTTLGTQQRIETNITKTPIQENKMNPAKREVEPRCSPKISSSCFY